MTVCGTKLVRFDEVVCMERNAGWKDGMIRSISWADGFRVLSLLFSSGSHGSRVRHSETFRSERMVARRSALNLAG